MKFGELEFNPSIDNLELVAAPAKEFIAKNQLSEVYVSKIDPSLADTTAFCDKYNIGLEVSANCVIVKAKRAERTWYVACMILANNRADINGVVKKYLDARKLSFAPIDEATMMTNMEYGGVTPIGLPADWRF